jgi:DNA mismatch repair protein MutS
MGMYDDYKEKLCFYKKEYGEHVALLYQVGGFYEIYQFEETNKNKLANDLDIRLTRKDGNKPFSESNPFFSGFPLSALNKFIKKLVNLPDPYIVVVIQQTENGSEIKDKKNVQRKLKGIYTKNVLPLDFEESVEDFLLVYSTQSWCLFNNQTNELIVCQTGVEISDSYLSKYKISQIIVIGNEIKDYNIKFGGLIPTIKKPDSKYDSLNYCENLITKVYSYTKNVENLLNEFTLFKDALSILCYTLDIIYSFNEKLLKSLSEPVILNNFSLDENLNLYLNTIKQLSLDSLKNYINNSSTAIGSRKLKDVLKNPYYYKKDIDNRLKLSETISKNYKSIAHKLNETTDFVKLHRQVSTNYFTPEKFKSLYDNYNIILNILETKELEERFNLKKSLIKSIKFLEENINLETETNTTYLNFFSNNKMPKSLIKLKTELNNKKKEQEEILSTYSEYDSNNFLKLEKSQDSIFLKITTIRLNSLPKLKELLVKENCKMTSVGSGSTKIIHPKLNNLFIKINEIENNILNEFNKYFILFCEEFTNLNSILFTPLKIFIEELDLAVLNNKNKEKYNYNSPIIIEGNSSFVNIKDLRHPIIERINESYEYITNDINLNSNGIILFGVNASGKSSLLKALGVSVVMAQAGLYGAYTNMELCPYNNLLTQVDMNDDMMLGESSFTNELIGIKEMFKISKISNRTLILADELTCGTENNSAIAIFGAVILELIKYKVSFFFTTHLQTIPTLSSLKDKIGKELRFYHLKVLFDEQKIIFQRKLQDGPCVELYGLEIARSLIKENSFLIEAESIRKEILGTKSQILENKKSRYNSKKIIDHCEICNYTLKSNTDLPLDVHHINFQCDSDKKTGIVNDKHFHKNALFNLVTVCKSCHIKIHKKEIIINGYIKTNLGKELDYV